MVNIEQAIEQIGKANEFMGDLLQCDQPVLDYCQQNLVRHDFTQTHLQRQRPYLELINKKIFSIFEESEVKIRHEEGMIIDTTDHHNILNFPSIVGAHLLDVLPTVFDRESAGDFYVLDCGNVPFGDVLHKCGIEFQNRHINLYPRSIKSKLVSRYPIYDFDFIKAADRSGHVFNDRERKYLKNIQEIVDSIDFSTCKRLSDQIVKINYYLWQEFFPEHERKNVRRCITLEHDEILIEFLQNFLAHETDNFVCRSLFDRDFRKMILEGFDGIYGAWNYSGSNTGTHFFWGFDKEEGKEHRMILDGDKLTCPSGKVRNVVFDPENVIDALKEGILIPSIFTKFSVVAFFLGAKTMGGPGQTEYTGKMQNKWLEIINKVDSKEFELIKKTSVLNFNCADVAFSRSENGGIVKEWAFDVAYRRRFSREYIANLNNTKFKYLIYPMVPISYYRLTPAKLRQELDIDESKLYEGLRWVK